MLLSPNVVESIEQLDRLHELDDDIVELQKRLTKLKIERDALNSAWINARGTVWTHEMTHEKEARVMI